MATRTDSKREKKQRASLETDVILVVKGAGEQAEDEHLNLFLRGFWPAVKALDKNATIARVSEGFDKLPPSPPNQDGESRQHVAEIDVTYEGRKRRIWVKESYWENEVLSSSALGNLLREWWMSSFVFANMFQDIFFTRNTKAVRNWHWSGNMERSVPGRAPGTRLVDYIGNYVSYFVLFLLVFMPFLQTIAALPIAGMMVPAGNWWYALMLVIAAAALWALAPAVEISRMTYLRHTQKIDLKALPGLPGWTLALLIILLVLDPIHYLSILLILLGIQVALLLARRSMWKYRKHKNSDVDRAEYYSYEETSAAGRSKRYGKVDESWLTRLPVSPLVYRYFVYLALPVGFAIAILVKFLKWTRLFGGVGEALDGFVKFLLVGYMDDVVNYATDPVQAYRVRSAVMNDIEHFHKRREVQRIHIVAHSQGTPITFETLFHYLDTKYQKKIFTYVTLGSVLGYYHQARGMLDEVYYNRFQMPIREDKFPAEFKWMNFWNFTDPITEFYGLDEYTWFKDAPTKPDEKYEDRSPTSPVNIRTHSSLAKNHGEYWSNIEQFDKPFAKRVLGDARPEEWSRELQTEPREWHHWAVLGLSVLFLGIFAGAGFGIDRLAVAGKLDFLFDFFTSIYTYGSRVYTGLFPPPEEPGLLQRLTAPPTLEFLGLLWGRILSGAFVILGVSAILDWAGQLIRVGQLGRNENHTKSASPSGTKT